jgi:hypothetical protein
VSNVFQLFEPKEKRELSIGLQNCPDNVVAKILASNAQLTRMVEEVSTLLDAFDHIIDALSDTDARIRLQQAMKLNREGLTNAMLTLSQQGQKLVGSKTGAGRSGCFISGLESTGD